MIPRALRVWAAGRGIISTHERATVKNKPFQCSAFPRLHHSAAQVEQGDLFKIQVNVMLAHARSSQALLISGEKRNCCRRDAVRVTSRGLLPGTAPGQD